MKKVVLLGDSIRQIGYGTVINKFLSNNITIWQPEDNCRFAQYTLRMLFENKDQIDGADVIHLNNGLWDVCDIFNDGESFTPINVYIDLIDRISNILLKYGKKVIFATTTPVRLDNPYNKNSTIVRYNEAVIPLLKKKGIIINDLYGLLVDDIDTNIREDDKIHLTDVAIEKCAKQVAEIITKNL